MEANNIVVVKVVVQVVVQTIVLPWEIGRSIRQKMRSVARKQATEYRVGKNADLVIVSCYHARQRTLHLHTSEPNSLETTPTSVRWFQVFAGFRLHGCVSPHKDQLVVQVELPNVVQHALFSPTVLVVRSGQSLEHDSGLTVRQKKFREKFPGMASHG